MKSARQAAHRDEDRAFALAGAEILADPSGALYWPEERMLVVADLHLEKGSAFAKRGVLLPPYDTANTLVRLAALFHRYAPRLVIALGDSFHDGDGPRRMSSADAATGLLDVRRLGDMLSRIRGRIVHKALDHVSPLAVPVMLEIGREAVYGEATEALLAEAEAELVKEATQ